MLDDVKSIDWKDPWVAAGRQEEIFAKQLQKELAPKHPLYGLPASAIGRRVDCDDVLFLLGDDTMAVVHLTWSEKQVVDPRWPWFELYASVDDFVENRMLPDIWDYNIGGGDGLRDPGDR